MLIYRSSENFPKDEVFGLTNQIRRASVSVTSNIAEGFSRQSDKEKIQFYSMALGSLTELQSQLEVAHDIGYLSSDEFNVITIQAILSHKLINGLIKATRVRSSS